MAKKIIRLIAVLIIVFSICGCEEPKGIEVGFTGTKLRRGCIQVAYKSDRVEFDIDDVTLDFFWGDDNPLMHDSYWNYYGDSHSFVTKVIVFFHCDSLSTSYPLDYSDPRIFLVKEIDGREFMHTDEYKYERVKNGIFKRRLSFNHSETLTIPKEALLDGNGYLGFNVWLEECLTKEGSEDVSSYTFATEGIYYKIEDNIVTLRKK